MMINSNVHIVGLAVDLFSALLMGIASLDFVDIGFVSCLRLDLPWFFTMIL